MQSKTEAVAELDAPLADVGSLLQRVRALEEAADKQRLSAGCEAHDGARAAPEASAEAAREVTELRARVARLEAKVEEQARWIDAHSRGLAVKVEAQLGEVLGEVQAQVCEGLRVARSASKEARAASDEISRASVARAQLEWLKERHTASAEDLAALASRKLDASDAERRLAAHAEQARRALSEIESRLTARTDERFSECAASLGTQISACKAEAEEASAKSGRLEAEVLRLPRPVRR